MPDDMIVLRDNGADVECRFDDRTGVLHLIVDGPLADGKLFESYLLEFIVHHRANRPLNGIVIFNRRDPRFDDVAAALQYRH